MRLLRKAWKSATKRMFPGAVTRITGGPGEGMLLSASASPDMISGTYEQERLGAFLQMMHQGDVFWDVGAHIGYVTLLASRTIPAAQLVAFEPWPSNRRRLSMNLAANKLEAAHVMSIALSDHSGLGCFGGGKGSGTKRVGVGSLQVETKKGDDLVRSGLPAPTVVKIDVEGHEREVLRGLEEALSGTIQVLMVSLHHQACFDGCQEILATAGFDVHIPERSWDRARAGFPERTAEAELLAIRPSRAIQPEWLQLYMEG